LDLALDPLAGPSNLDDPLGETGKKKRAPRPKLDEERLLGPKGFPKLLEEAKKFKFGPKGKEVLFPMFFSLTTKN